MNQNGSQVPKLTEMEVAIVNRHLTCSEGSPAERSLTRCVGGGTARRSGSGSSVAGEVGGDAAKFNSVLGTTTGSLSWVSAGDDVGVVEMKETPSFNTGLSRSRFQPVKKRGRRRHHGPNARQR